MLIGFDPGKDKCGLAVLNQDRQVFFHKVIKSSEAIANIQFLIDRYPISLLVIGDRTTSNTWQNQLKNQLPQLKIFPVDESYSSQVARQRYWQLYPPRGLGWFIPEGMRSPPRAVDDIVAIILVERYLDREFSLKKP
jgi:RNase H-fold protein (predicted Holliday junction resolvase)